MDKHDITELRLHNLCISHPQFREPLDLVEHMGAMQAQDYHGSLWTLGLRTGLTQGQIIQALEEQAVIRTWPHRGTIHLVPAKDAKWMVGLSAERLFKGAAGRRKNLGLNDATLARSQEVLEKALSATPLLTRPEVMATLEASGISTASNRGYHILWYLSQSGITYIGPMREKQQTFGLLKTVAPNPKTLSREAGIAELAKRYFTSHGPATMKDFRWWSGLTATEAKAGLAVNQDLFAGTEVDGQEYWMPKIQSEVNKNDEAFLLPGFDEYMLGYTDRTAALPAEHAGKIVPGSNGMFLPTIIIRGQVVGIWKRTIKVKGVEIALSPFKPLSKADLALLDEPIASYQHFVELPVSIKG